MNAPLQILLELTLACNQRCRHCLAGAGLRGKDELSTDEIKAVLESLQTAGVVNVVLSGGEPLLRTDFCELVEFLAEIGPGQSFFVNTNGILWTNQEMKAIAGAVKKGSDISIQVSLDGAEPDIYNRLRNDTEENYHKVIKNVRQMKRYGLNVSVIFTFTRYNSRVAIETAKFALEELNLDGFLVIPVFPTGRAAKNYIDLNSTEEDWADFIVQMTKIKAERSWGDRTDLLQVGFFTYYQLALPLIKAGLAESIYQIWNYPKPETNLRLFSQGGLCKAGKSELCITANGNIYPCVPARGGPFLMGNIRERAWTEIWKSSSIMEYFRTGRLTKFEEPCSSCDYLSSCAGGCRVFTQTMTGEIGGPDLCCPEVIHWQQRQQNAHHVC